MKQSLSPGIIVGAIVGLIAVVGVIFFFATRSPAGINEGQASGGGIPPEIQKQIQQQMSGAGATAPATNGGRPAGAPGGMMPPGAPGGMIAPPPGASGMGGR
ncbi:hypothetical protein [Armatimonas sp.]|uniref:hypothetical protein n=1 Tax=Armatimonas sp. TaxID=1872638 RepID=UPI003751D288